MQSRKGSLDRQYNHASHDLYAPHILWIDTIHIQTEFHAPHELHFRSVGAFIRVPREPHWQFGERWHEISSSQFQPGEFATTFPSGVVTTVQSPV